ncbi:potential E3 ubiquitin-protein ligase ariadne-2-like [Lineus longissimus]|uniref:potential E3 ubiquitin-protein ligase ariadne-2-like n=1 Tax=Lineus longissimus TaxID=88925 RepID=UPI002B4EEA47
MSVDMNTDGSDMEDYGSDEDNYDNYYDDNADDVEFIDKSHLKEDPEYFEFELLKIEDVERLLNENVEAVCNELNVTPSRAKVLLHAHRWAKDEIIQRHKRNPEKLLVDSRILPKVKQKPTTNGSKSTMCPVCLSKCPSDSTCAVACGHLFCKDCWEMHFMTQINQGISTGIECMGKDCNVLVPEDFVMQLVNKPECRDRYQQLGFRDHILSNPELRFCPGPNCAIVVRAVEIKQKRVICSYCKTTFCFRCGIDYHSPTDCDVIKKWLTKCADDSETANYISAHTKDCPKCHVCIEKNGGCNHMQCSKCKHDFCWMCLGDWKAHGSEYYECSRYKENPNIANESVHAKAREALKKYLFYFERWENHAKSLKLEEQTLKKIKDRIHDKVMNNAGTWIDWQYLLDAASLLKKCRYTLQYTYPYAYYLEKGPRKQLFEYQQAQLEAEVENLSWKVERAEITDRGDLENQMDIAEKRRLTLLKDFIE